MYFYSNNYLIELIIDKIVLLNIIFNSFYIESTFIYI